MSAQKIEVGKSYKTDLENVVECIGYYPGRLDPYKYTMRTKNGDVQGFTEDGECDPVYPPRCGNLIMRGPNGFVEEGE